jgi:predicted transcriptional regulator
MLQNNVVKLSLNDPKKRRGRLEIASSILKAAKKGAQKTQIMYHANLSFTQSSEYINLLIKSGLLETRRRNKKILYKTTSKGIKFIKNYEELKNLLVGRMRTRRHEF